MKSNHVPHRRTEVAHAGFYAEELSRLIKPRIGVGESVYFGEFMVNDAGNFNMIVSYMPGVSGPESLEPSPT